MTLVGVDLVTLPRVEILATGDWPTAKGPGKFTERHLLDISRASQDPGFVAPRVKLGHTSPLNEPDEVGDARPSYGRFENIHTDASGRTLVADQVAVPRWLGESAASAYPGRSVEVRWNVTSPATGKFYTCVLDAVAMLGTTIPAVTSLADIKSHFSQVLDEATAAASDDAGNIEGSSVVVLPERQTMTKTLASASTDDVVSEFYNKYEATRPEWWVRDVLIEPTALIVSDCSTGKLYEVGYSASEDGSVAFDAPQEVRVEYAPVGNADSGDDQATAASAAAAHRLPVVSRAARSESRPTHANTEEEENDMSDVRTSLGLSEDATDEQVAAEIARLKALDTPETPEGGEGGPTGPAAEGSEDGSGAPPADGTAAEVADAEAHATAAAAGEVVSLDTATFEALKADAAAGREARARQIAEDREATLASAVEDGRIPRSRVDHWRDYLARDPKGASELSALKPGLVPVDGEIGSMASAAEQATEAEAVAAATASFGINTRKDG